MLSTQQIAMKRTGLTTDLFIGGVPFSVLDQRPMNDNESEDELVCVSIGDNRKLSSIAKALEEDGRTIMKAELGGPRFSAWRFITRKKSSKGFGLYS